MDKLQHFAEGAKQKVEKIGVEIQKAVNKRKHVPVFGRSLEDFTEAELIEGVPIPVYRATEFLCSGTESLKESGLFRIAAVQSEVKALKGYYDRGEDPDLSDLYGTPHTVSNMLKAFFRELPEPLLTFELYDCFIAANTICVPQPRLECIQKIIRFLPPQNFTLLVYLCKFLRVVSGFSADNKMTATNLATVFAPNLLRPETESASTTIEDTPHASSMMQTMITDFEFLFGSHVAQERFDFEYFVAGQKPPATPSPASPLVPSSSSGDIREASAETSSRAAKPPALPPKPPSNKPAPPKPARTAFTAEEEEPDVPPPRPARERPKPMFRPLTILESPPVRPPRQGEVAQLTSQFNRISQAVAGGNTFEGFTPSGPPPTTKPALPLIAHSVSSLPTTKPVPSMPAKAAPASLPGVRRGSTQSSSSASPSPSSSTDYLVADEAPQVSVSARVRTLTANNPGASASSSPDFPASFSSPSSSTSLASPQKAPPPSAQSQSRPRPMLPPQAPPTTADPAKVRALNSGRPAGFVLDADKKK